MNIENVIDFFKWSFILNYSLMCFSALIIYFFMDSMYSIHKKLGFYSDNKDNYRSFIFNYFGQWKMLVIIFNLIPWIVLKIIEV